MQFSDSVLLKYNGLAQECDSSSASVMELQAVLSWWSIEWYSQ